MTLSLVLLLAFQEQRQEFQTLVRSVSQRVNLPGIN